MEEPAAVKIPPNDCDVVSKQISALGEGDISFMPCLGLISVHFLMWLTVFRFVTRKSLSPFPVGQLFWLTFIFSFKFLLSLLKYFLVDW